MLFEAMILAFVGLLCGCATAAITQSAKTGMIVAFLIFFGGCGLFHYLQFGRNRDRV